MQYSVVNYKTVKENSDFRIDSEFYHPVILNRLNLLDHKRNEQLGKLVEFVVGPFGSTVTVDKYVDESDYRYIRNKDINNFVISDNDPALIPENVYKPLKQFHIQKNDLLLTVVGTLGKAAIALEKDNKSIFSCKSTLFSASSTMKCNTLESRKDAILSGYGKTLYSAKPYRERSDYAVIMGWEETK